MRAKVGICIPWRPSPTRLAAFDVTMRMFKEQFPDVQIYLGDEPRARPFNVSAARNVACEAALADGCEVLVVSDADVLPDRSNIEKAIEMVEGGEGFVVPFTTACYLSESASVDVLNGRDFDTSNLRMSGGWSGGIAVISKECFRALNGWDERFMSWGQEDDAFSTAYRVVFKKPHARVEGFMYTLFHEDRDRTHEKKNFQLIGKYNQELADNEEELVKYLLKNRLNWG